jgi:hypothetical protein
MLQFGMRLCAGIKCLETRRDERGVRDIVNKYVDVSRTSVKLCSV